MHILVVNDDGPPSNESSPYVHSLVSALQARSHTVSVVLPHTQRSWIGKAHFVGQTVKPTYFRPGRSDPHADDSGTVHDRPPKKGTESGAGDEEWWVLVDGTPASCAQLGLHHLFRHRGPVDLVISGPNYGRNTTALFALSSGTIGAAMEAAVCGTRAVALSFAFYSREHDPEVIAEASRLAVRVAEGLAENWGADVDLYSVNIPLVKGVEGNKVMVTRCLANVWTSGSSFEEVPETEDPDGEEREKEIRKEEEEKEGQQPAEPGSDGDAQSSGHRHRHFKWAPKFSDVYQSVEKSGPGYDGWTINQGMTSVTPMKAKFAEAQAHPVGELKLSTAPSKTSPAGIHIAYEDPYVQPLILLALSSLPSESFRFMRAPVTDASRPYLQVSSYETIDHDALLSRQTYMANSYTIRKALIRKHYLANTVALWISKHPLSLLKYHVPVTVPFELDFAEFLDDALVEAWELHKSWERNETCAEPEREWWILKPGMSDRGQGIRLFSSEAELTAIFEQWEEENPEDEEDEDGETQESSQTKELSSKGLITSQLRHFIAQPYIQPLLLPEHSSRKFHIRTYVVCTGALSVYVYRDMLALFAAESYTRPQCAADGGDASTIDLRRHLTNTCLQDGTREGSVLRYWELHIWDKSVLDAAFRIICDITAELFRAAAADPINFQPLPNAFEVFGVDWLLDATAKPWLLEVNAFPDFKQTGGGLRAVVAEFWKETIKIVGKDLLHAYGEAADSVSEDMVQVLSLDLGRR